MSVRANIAIHLPDHVTTGLTAEVLINPETGQACASISAPPALVQPLKIHGEALRKEDQDLFKILWLSRLDTATSVVHEMLEKYGIDKSLAADYCLVQFDEAYSTLPFNGGEGQVVGATTTREYILEEDECPLNILMQEHRLKQGAITFHVRRRSPDGTGEFR